MKLLVTFFVMLMSITASAAGPFSAEVRALKEDQKTKISVPLSCLELQATIYSLTSATYAAFQNEKAYTAALILPKKLIAQFHELGCEESTDSGRPACCTAINQSCCN